jgi:hypothetical protein
VAACVTNATAGWLPEGWSDGWHGFARRVWKPTFRGRCAAVRDCKNARQAHAVPTIFIQAVGPGRTIADFRDQRCEVVVARKRPGVFEAPGQSERKRKPRTGLRCNHASGMPGPSRTRGLSGRFFREDRRRAADAKDGPVRGRIGSCAATEADRRRDGTPRGKTDAAARKRFARRGRGRQCGSCP